MQLKRGSDEGRGLGQKIKLSFVKRLLISRLTRTDFFNIFDRMGATVVCDTGNRGYIDRETGQPFRYQAELLPQSLATDVSPLISVGGVVSEPF